MQDGMGQPRGPSTGEHSFQIKFLAGPREGEFIPLEGERITIGHVYSPPER